MNCALPMSLPGVPCVRRSTIATRAVAINCASVAIHRSILLHWNKVSSDQACRPRNITTSVEGVRLLAAGGGCIVFLILGLLLIPISVLRDHSKMREVSHRTE